jgi:hypothetical protein
MRESKKGDVLRKFQREAKFSGDLEETLEHKIN